MMRTTAPIAIVGCMVAAILGCAAAQIPKGTSGSMGSSGSGVPDSVAFSLVLERIRDQTTGPLRIDPSPLRDEVFFADQPHQADTSAVLVSARSARARWLTALGVPEDEVERALGCILNGLETPEQRAGIRAQCPITTPYGGAAIGIVTRSDGDHAPNGLVGSWGPWRVRAVQYAVHPSSRGSWSVFDYYLSQIDGRWRIVGRSTVLHAN